MDSNKLNICTVTLGTDAKIVNENLIEFNRLYQNVKLHYIKAHSRSQDEHSLGNEQADHLAYLAIKS